MSHLMLSSDELDSAATKPFAPFDLSQLAGSTAVITGAANKGIGWGIAQVRSHRVCT